MKAEYEFSQGRRGAVVPQTGKTRITIDGNVLNLDVMIYTRNPNS